VKYLNKLKPLTRLNNLKNVYGFDIETFDNNKEFVCGSIVNPNKEILFFTNQEKMKNFFFNWNDKNQPIFVATNLNFDITALFGNNINNHPCVYPIKPFFRSSQMISAKLKSNADINIKFLDTMNFSPMGVEKMGKILGYEKMEKPDFTKDYRLNKQDFEYLKAYNIQDALISFKIYEAFALFADKFQGKLKMTISSLAMDVWRRHFLDFPLLRHDIEIGKEQRNAYSGGRCECFSRGYIEDYNLYDVNGMYTYIMMENDFPNPNSLKILEKGDINNIFEKDGISFVEVNVPYTYIPILFYRTNKLRFPYGKFSGWFTHIELREALKDGTEILYIGKQYYYEQNYPFFKKYAKTMYDLRRKYQQEGNKMFDLASKLMGNGLYGKFAQNNEKLKEIVYIDDFDNNDLDNFKCDFNKNYVTVLKKPNEKNTPAFVIPIFSIQITALARILITQQMRKYKAIYGDTDSLLTQTKIPTSNDLGDLKLEGHFKKGWIIKPKVYFLEDDNDIFRARAKGISKANYDIFLKIINHEKIPIIQWRKFHSLNKAKDKNAYYNEPITIMKNLCLEDDKRLWENKFDYRKFEVSQPIYIKA
jgi:hypothetical protein